MGKQLSSKATTFVKGGKTGLVGKQSKTGTQVPGQTAQMGRNGKVAAGGPSGKVGKQKGSVAAKAGMTASN
jgi:hypothetical protein